MNKDKHLTDEQLALYAGLLRSKNTEAAGDDIALHIAECNQCAYEALELSFILDDIGIKQTTEKFNISKKRRVRKYYVAAAAILLPILIWTAISLFTEIDIPTTVKQFFPNRINDTVNRYAKDQQIDTLIKDDYLKPNPENLLADAYIPHPETENIVNSFKTGSYRSDEIVIKSDSELSFLQTDKIRLSWENPDALELVVEIFDNKCVNILSESVSSNSYEIHQQLKPGLYYWKLFNNEYDLLFCGKILIKLQ